MQKSKLKLNHAVEAFLVANWGKIFTYKELAGIFNRGPRGIGSCMRSIGNRSPEVTKFVVKTPKVDKRPHSKKRKRS